MSDKIWESFSFMKHSSYFKKLPDENRPREINHRLEKKTALRNSETRMCRKVKRKYAPLLSQRANARKRGAGRNHGGKQPPFPPPPFVESPASRGRLPAPASLYITRMRQISDYAYCRNASPRQEPEVLRRCKILSQIKDTDMSVLYLYRKNTISKTRV